MGGLRDTHDTGTWGWGGCRNSHTFRTIRAFWHICHIQALWPETQGYPPGSSPGGGGTPGGGGGGPPRGPRGSRRESVFPNREVALQHITGKLEK